MNARIIISTDGWAKALSLNSVSGKVLSEGDPAIPKTLITKQQCNPSVASSYDGENACGDRVDPTMTVLTINRLLRRPSVAQWVRVRLTHRQEHHAMSSRPLRIAGNEEAHGYANLVFA